MVLRLTDALVMMGSGLIALAAPPAFADPVPLPNASAAARARILPGLADAELLARHLEYLLRGVGNEEEARTTVSALSHLESNLSSEQAELRSFLLAEASTTRPSRNCSRISCTSRPPCTAGKL